MIKDFLRRWKFYLRWFIIGKAHCPTSDRIKKTIRLGHKIIWGVITISVAVTTAQIVTWFFD